MTTKIEELEKEVKSFEKKINLKLFENNSIVFPSQKFADRFWKLIEMKNKKEYLKGFNEGRLSFAKVSSNYSVGRQETLAEVEKMIDEMKEEGAFIGTKETLKLPNYIKSKLEEMKK